MDGQHTLLFDVSSEELERLLGEEMNRNRIAREGVEDQKTFEFLKTIECDKMQGFLISEAVIPSIIRRVYSSKEEVPGEVA